MPRTIWCKHYRGRYHNDTCEAGVIYADLPVIPADQSPCFGPGRNGCSLAEYPTAEEIAAEDRMFREAMERTKKARAAIVSHIGPWKRGEGAGGSIPCPVCETGTLKYSRAGCNGHIHAACTTADCVRWME